MDTGSDDTVLESLAAGNSMNYEQWPDLLSRLLPRLDKIAHKTFTVQPIPPPSETIPSSPPQIQSQEPNTIAETSSQKSTSSTQSTNKENAPAGVDSTPGTLPPHILSLLKSITSTLNTFFSKYPPHTIQRFAELILDPRKHYKSLPSYLHAVDRVVHVTSGAQTFPLPPAVPDPASASVLSNGPSSSTPAPDPLSISWGNPTSNTASNLTSDDNLGGALLTPIPWLTKPGSSSPTTLEGEVRTESTETIEGPNGPGGIETVSVSVNGISSTRDSSSTSPVSPPENNGQEADLRAEGGVTQGELLRQEQKAGVVPATQLSSNGNKGDTDGMGEQDEAPHARGPDEIGMEDMGPQSAPVEKLGLNIEKHGSGLELQGINVEAAVGRRAEGSESGDDHEGIKKEKMEKDVRPGTPITPKRMADEIPRVEQKRLKVEMDLDVKEETDEQSKKEVKKEEEKGDSENVEMVDADGKTEDEKKVGERGRLGANAVDTTAL